MTAQQITEKCREKMVKFMFFMIALIIGAFLKKYNERRLEAKNKLKYFKPTIKESWYGTTVSWEMRDKPLTNEEVRNLI